MRCKGRSTIYSKSYRIGNYGYQPMYTAAGYDTVRRAGRRTVVRKQVAG